MNLPNLYNILNLPAYSSLNFLLPAGLLLFAVIFLIFLGLNLHFIKLLGQASCLEDKKEAEYDNATKTLLTAQKQALQIVKDANGQAKKILEDAGILGKEMVTNMDKNLEAFTKEQKDFLSEATERLLKVHRKALLEASKESLADLEEASFGFKEDIAQEIHKFRDYLGSMASEARNDVKKELAQYKLQRKEQLDEEIYAIVRDASEEILGHSLSMQEHEDFIMQVLQEAKNKGVFRGK